MPGRGRLPNSWAPEEGAPRKQGQDLSRVSTRRLQHCHQLSLKSLQVPGQGHSPESGVISVLKDF